MKEIESKNLINGNINPRNIIIISENDLDDNDLDDNYKLSNYNLYKILKINEYENDEIYYLSPEIILEKEISIKSDIWSFGCLLFYLINGYNLFHNKNIKDLIKTMNHENYKIKENELNIKEKEILSKLLKSNPLNRPLLNEIEIEIESINYNIIK